MMSTKFRENLDIMEELIQQQYPQLSNIAFFDYTREAPIPTSSLEKMNSLGHKLMPSPHSSEEQSEFDRVLMLLRKSSATLFNVSLANFDVIVFGSAESALNTIFESFRWTNGSKFIIDESFSIPTESSIPFAMAAGATKGDVNSPVVANSLLCVSSGPSGSAASSRFRGKKPGNEFVLADATRSAPYNFADIENEGFDYVLLSMKQICGIDLCLGLFKKVSAELLVPSFYGGGAVAFSCARALIHRNFSSNTKRFENGTPPLMSIFAAYEGLCLMNTIREMVDVNERVNAQMRRLASDLGEDKVVINDEFKIVYIATENADETRAMLLGKRVICGVENGRLRVSFGLSTTEKDIDALISAMTA